MDVVPEDSASLPHLLADANWPDLCGLDNARHMSLVPVD